MARHEEQVRSWEARSSEQQAELKALQAKLQAEQQQLMTLSDDLQARDKESAAAKEKLARDVQAASQVTTLLCRHLRFW